MSYPYTHRTIIVPTASQQLAQDLCAVLARLGLRIVQPQEPL